MTLGEILHYADLVAQITDDVLDTQRAGAGYSWCFGTTGSGQRVLTEDPSCV